MLKKLFITAAAAAAVSVPLAGIAQAAPSDNGNDGGVGKGGIPARAGAVLDSVNTPPNEPPLNPNGVGAEGHARRRSPPGQKGLSGRSHSGCHMETY